MGLADDPCKLILRLFEMEDREGRGKHCHRFPEGAIPEGLPLECGERVYGVYKDKYFFTPASLLVRHSKGVDRIAWNSIRACSTQHGDGMRVSKLTLVDGTTLDIRVGEMATGWSGRVSQLYHQMIEHYGNRASLGARLCSIDEFFAQAKDDYSIFPNLEPHPSLGTLRAALEALRNRPDVTDVLLITDTEDGGPVCNGVIIRTPASPSEFSEFVASFGADGLVPASANEIRQIRDIREGENVWHIAWD